MLEQKKFILYNPCDMGKRWFVRWKDENGRWQKNFGGINRGKTFEERTALATELLKKLQPGVDLNSPQWYKSCIHGLNSQSKTYKPTTLGTYKGAVDSLQAAVGDDLTQSRFEDYIKTLHPNTARTYLAAYKAAFSLAKIEIKTSIKIKPKAQRPAKYFSRDLKRYVLSAMQKIPSMYELEMVCKLQHYCFLRPKEILALEHSDFEMGRRQIRTDELCNKTNRLMYARIPQIIMPELQQFLDTRKTEPKLFKYALCTIFQKHRALLKALDLKNKGYKLYSWKHTGAVTYIENGGKIKTLQTLMRHQSLEMTAKYLRQMGIDELDNSYDIFTEM